MTEELHVHVHIDGLDEIRSILTGQVVPLLRTLRRQEALEMAAIDDLAANVAADTSVDQSAITLLNGLKAALDAAIASGNPAQLQQLSDQLGQNVNALAASVTANTPVQPPPPPPGS